MTILNSLRFIRINELTETLRVSRVTLWRWERQGLIPPKRKIGPNTVGWLATEIEAWLASTAPPADEATDLVADSDGTR